MLVSTPRQRAAYVITRRLTAGCTLMPDSKTVMRGIPKLKALPRQFDSGLDFTLVGKE